MELYRGTAALNRRLRRPVLTIGNFDGIHLGHRAIMEIVVNRARALGGEAVVFTFDPHPRKVLQPERAPKLLTTVEQKCELLEALGVDVLIVERFDQEFSRNSPEFFVNDYVHRRIQPMEVYVGYDFHFGKDREGSMRLLTETGPRLGFAVTIIPEVTRGERDVNSTRIRELVQGGEVESASELLGRPFAVRGRVVRGDGRGRGIGFPTANLCPDNEIMPAAGVYGGEFRLLDDGRPARGSVYPVAANVGIRPTFGGDQELLAEAHLIDFEGDLYDRRAELSFRFHLRSEQKFPNVEALSAQIGRDVERAKRRLQAS